MSAGRLAFLFFSVSAVRLTDNYIFINNFITLNLMSVNGAQGFIPNVPHAMLPNVYVCAFASPKMNNSGVSSCLSVWRVPPNVAESVIRDMVGPDWKQRWLNWKNRTPEQVSVSLQW